MRAYAIIPSIGLNQVAPTVYVVARTEAQAVACAQRVTGPKAGYYRITGWPGALLTRLPSNVKIHYGY